MIHAGWIWTLGQLQLMMVTKVAYGLGLGCSSTSWNPYEVYFHMDLEYSEVAAMTELLPRGLLSKGDASP